VTLLGAAWQTGHVIDDRDADASRLAAEALAQDDPTGWFERLYAEAAAGDAIVPWDRDEPNPLLVDWTERRRLDGAGRRAMVVGCGLGRDAEHVAGLGFHTTAFDISQTAVRGARERFPESTVDYVVADLLDPPTGWAGVFDLVVESITVQSMPLSVRADAITHIGQMVARGGELVVISGIREEGEHVDGPPWPLTRAEVDSFAVGGLRATHIEQASRPDAPDAQRWRAAFRRA
jgi:SAM-dependent methyltransferase